MKIEELREASKRNARFSGTFIISKCELKPFKQKSGFFMQCLLTDKTGSVKGIIWDQAEKLREKVKNNTVVEVTGETARYNDNPQAVIKTVTPKEDFDKSDFIPSLDKDRINQILQGLDSIAETIDDPFYQKMWSFVLGENSREIFSECPGGIGDVHHAYMGGLMEHTYSIITTAKSFLEQPGAPALDKNLLLTGALIHDIGKVQAYSWDTVIEMNDTGRLLHHVPLGVMMLKDIVDEEFAEVKPEDYTKFLNLLHIIISHHDCNEEGGHRKPMTPEAVAIARIDAMDASVAHAFMFSGNEDNLEEDSNWTRYCHLTGVRYFKPAKSEDGKEGDTPKEEKKESEEEGLDLDELF